MSIIMFFLRKQIRIQAGEKICDKDECSECNLYISICSNNKTNNHFIYKQNADTLKKKFECCGHHAKDAIKWMGRFTNV